ncbi:MAG: hypothetical protein HY319_15635 [Armatimonadetes bacterium]|nr:hypothetical protein [Armatimonadota bacterium]
MTVRFVDGSSSKAAYLPMLGVGRVAQTHRFELEQTLESSHRMIQFQVVRPYKGRKGVFGLDWPLDPATSPSRTPATPRPAPPRPPVATRAPVPRPSVSEQALATALQEMKKELPSPQFRFVREGFFVVASDLGESELKAVRSFALQDCCGALLKELFPTRPAQPVRVYLFKDDKSYRAWTQKLFKSPPPTPYGYFDGSRNALVMNIATGEGTLVHEMTHALSNADFPQCPPWLFEGLGSLYEMPYLSKGRLRGAVNWRLPRLQKAIQEKKTLPLRKLLALNSHEFYSQNAGLNYAEARYLLMFLQERGLLAGCYKQLREAYPSDPTGTATLEKAWGGPLEQLETEWKRWALQLH